MTKILARKRAGYCIALAGMMLLLLNSSRALSQETMRKKVSLHFENTLISKALKEVARQLNVGLSYAPEMLEDKLITLNLTDMEAGVALERVLSGTNTSAYIDGDGMLSLKKNSISSGQAGPGAIVITGTVKDAKDGTPLPGASIRVEGSGTGTHTDEQGKFSIRVPNDKAVLVFSIVGYAGRRVKAGEYEHTRFDIRLRQDNKTLEAVTVEARKKVNNENALLNERRKAAVISDGISARNIEKTASITVTQALQRVTGVTITDEKYVAIRGLGDRSVIAELNGARLSSADPDRTSVPLDLIPAGLLDNITVYKTLTPDRPADASAGIVELKTKSVPDSMVLSFIVQAGANSTIGLGGRFNAFRNYDPGFFGEKVNTHNLSPDFLALKELYPGGRRDIQKLFIDSRNTPELAAEANRVNKLMLGLDPVITTSYQKAKPDQLYNVIFGNTYRVFNGHALGIILGGNYYSRTEDRYHADLNQWSIYQGVLTGTGIFNRLHVPNFISPDNINLGRYLAYKENTGIRKLNYGVLAGATYQITKNHEVGIQYMGSRGAEVTGTNLIGEFTNTGLVSKIYNNLFGLKQSFRVFNTLNLQGEHKLDEKIATRIGWAYSRSNASTNEPDYRFVNVVNKRDQKFVDQSGVGIGSDEYALVVGLVHGIGPAGAILADPNGRRYRTLKENNTNFKIDVTQPFFVKGQKQEFKVGYSYLKRTRDFTENILGLPGNYGILSKYDGNPDALVAYNNIGLKDPAGYNNEGQPRVGGFLYEIRKSPNNYTGEYKTESWYGMLDLHPIEQLRVVGGVRFESTDIGAQVDTVNVAKDNFIDPSLLTPPDVPIGFQGQPKNTYVAVNPKTGYKQSLKPYYSVNLTYTYRQNMNFRLAFNTSLARPELREITNLYQFDPFQFAVVGGNPSLVNQFTKSLDFRWEWFPHQGEVLSASVFGKLIDHQLTKVFILNSQGNNSYAQEYPIVKFINDPEQGKVYGIELEIRKNLGTLWKPLSHVFLGSNVMFAASVIKKNKERLDASRIVDRRAPETSPLFEQAPYSVNAYIDYDNQRQGTSLTASFNVVGERLIQVQLDGTPDIYERPAPILDFIFSQRVFRRFVVKGFVKNIINPPFREVYTYPGNKGIFYGTQYIRHQYYKGTQYSLGITYNIF
ncbi:MAG: carboxypeptidase-like regulatory domain-containing protein [Chitinophagaceae bacterium]|nr:carboxypeptidase-like regulatory domain-containing protein [Chitinophagaceae bacterium]